MRSHPLDLASNREQAAALSAAGEIGTPVTDSNRAPLVASGPTWSAATRKLRVAIVSDAVTGRNGVGTYYLDLVQYLQDYVGNIQLIGPDRDKDPSVEWFSVPMPGDPTQRLAWPKLSGLYRVLDAQSPNIIVIPSLGAFSYFALRYAGRHQIPIALVSHTNFEQLLSLYWPAVVARPLEWALGRINRWLVRQATAVAAMNGESFQEAARAGAQVVRVMGTPLSRDFLCRPATPSCGVPCRAVFVGRLAAEKGVDRILSAARELPSIQFVVAGDGPLRKRVERAAGRQANLRYLGWIAREQVLQQIDEAQILLLPSTVETFGTVALEALARRRYVVVSRDCGIARWPSFAKGLFYTERDETLTQSLRRVCLMPEEQRQATAAHGWHAVQAFNDYTVRTWLKFLFDAAGL